MRREVRGVGRRGGRSEDKGVHLKIFVMFACVRACFCMERRGFFFSCFLVDSNETREGGRGFACFFSSQGMGYFKR